MQRPVAVELLSEHGYRATGGGPLALAAEWVEVPQADDPARRFAGMFHDNPLFDEWQAAMREYREQRQSETERDLP